MRHQAPNRIIFLDVDGVINTAKHHYQRFDKECLDNLQHIIDQTGAKIVVSSSWRSIDLLKVEESFMTHGFTERLWDQVIDCTIRGYQCVVRGSKLPIVRGNEIKAWVDTHLVYPWHADPSLDEAYRILNPDGSFKMMHSNKLGVDFNYVILDDDEDMLYEQRNNFVHTYSEVGLTSNQADKAIEILIGY